MRLGSLEPDIRYSPCKSTRRREAHPLPFQPLGLQHCPGLHMHIATLISLQPSAVRVQFYVLDLAGTVLSIAYRSWP